MVEFLLRKELLPLHNLLLELLCATLRADPSDKVFLLTIPLFSLFLHNLVHLGVHERLVELSGF
jgi:hypothetical protein